MPYENLRPALAAKITTLEAYQAAVAGCGYSILSTVNNLRPRADGGHVAVHETTLESSWPLRREIMRELSGVYPEPTSVLRWLRTAGVGQQFPHISKDDPTMVAFTPDQQSGFKDVQVRTTMGKLLRRFLLVVSDDEISRLESQHRAELDPSFELATTPAAIENVYRQTQGDTGCMRYSRAHFNLTDYHPSAAYTGPGLGVAYVNKDGGIAARSVVYVNPADPLDKRYVRIYGDPVLKRKLESQGYRCAGLAGVQLAALRDSNYPNAFVTPYLDPAGGGGSPFSTVMEGFGLVRYKGEGTLRVITQEVYTQLRTMGITPAAARSQAGTLEVPEVDASEFTYTCALSGVAVDRMVTPSAWFLNSSGQIVQVRSSALATFKLTHDTAQLKAARSGRAVYVHGRKEDCIKFSVPGFAGMFNDADTLAANSMVRLDPALYSVPQYAVMSDTFRTAGLTYLLKADTLQVYDADGAHAVQHIGQVKALRKQGYESTAVIGRSKAMSHKDNPALKVTVSGRRVMAGVHEVSQLIGGQWDYTAHTQQFAVLNAWFTVPKATLVQDVVLSADDVSRATAFTSQAAYYQLDDRFAAWALNAVKQNLTFGGRSANSYSLRDGQLVGNYYRSSATLEAVEAGADRVLSLHAAGGDALTTALGYDSHRVLCWARATRTFLDLYHAERLARLTAAAAQELADDALLLALAA